LAKTLARAFFDDPVMMWAFPDDAKRLQGAEHAFGLHLGHWLQFDEVYTEDGLRAAALWGTPGHWEFPPLLGIRLFMTAGITAVPRLVRGFSKIEKGHPHAPHHYLAVLGTDPSAQGQGLGTAVLKPVLDRCDADGVAAYLESSKERNVAYYARHGFKVTQELDVPGGGPRIWLMWRDPLGSGPAPGI
jgi:GNAT superfamily N-acetyltransferase